MDADIVIVGGEVVDGTGGPAHRSDVAITDGRISAIADNLDAVGRREDLNASDAVVSPGFIDIHTHYDAQVWWDPALTPSCYHGVTTVVAGNCGLSLAPTRPAHRRLMAETFEFVEDMSLASLEAGIDWTFQTFPEQLDSLAERGTLVNYTGFVGHTALRLFVMGDDGYERAASDDEIGRMADLLGEAIDAGAAGFSTSFGGQVGAGGRPVPSRLASNEEFEVLARAVAASGRGIVACLPAVDMAADYLYDLSLQADVPITMVALVSESSGRHDERLAAHRRGLDRGARVWPQVSPLPIVSTFTMAKPVRLQGSPLVASLFPQPVEARRAAYADRDWRRRAFEALPTDEVYRPRPQTYTITSCTAHTELEGRRVVDVADERGVSWFDLMLDLAIDEPDLGLVCVAPVANDDEEVVTRLLKVEHCALGLSDAGAHVTQLCDANQPTVLLGEWVRERGALALPEAVHKLSGAQADLLGLRDRGRLEIGAHADVNVFEPATIAAGPKRVVRDFPAGEPRITCDQPVGIRHTLVNGVPIRRGGSMVDPMPAPLPGSVLR
jgi:N-acyl-D-aspartate/D-glutamate deacylase